MDIGKSISFVFDDKKWLEKTLIGGILLIAIILLSWTIIVPIIGGALLSGYTLQIIRNVRRRDAQPLPEWDEWGEKTMLGLKLLVVTLIWSAPLIIVAFFGLFLAILFGDSNASDFVGVFFICFSCLAMLYGLLLIVVSPALYIRVADTSEMGPALNVGEVLSFTRDHIGDIIIATIVVLAVQMIAGLIGTIACMVGLFFTTIWAMFVQGHLYGQIGMDAVEPESDGAGYDLSPEDVMPGVGELADEIEAGADTAVAQIQDLGEAVEETAEDSAEQAADKLTDGE